MKGEKEEPEENEDFEILDVEDNIHCEKDLQE